jgi:20S proteasome subunit beta 5
MFNSFVLLQPAENLARFSTEEYGRGIKIQFDHGTTNVGFRYQGGVVLAVDSRATTGSFVGWYPVNFQLIYFLHLM